jgi:zinc protease
LRGVVFGIFMSVSDHEKIRILDRWDVCRHRLPSGLKVLLLEDRSTPLISYHTWFGAGSRHEREGKTGLAHLFEHLMFESTMRHPSGSFDREMERFGAETNAATWLDWTYYHETFPPEALELVLDFEPDRMTNVILDEKVLDREKSVVMNERKYRVDDRVEGIMEEVLYKTAFTVHPYRNPTIGWMEDIRGFTLEDCTGFYRTYYSPGNAVVVAAGSFDHDEMVRAIEEKYAAIPSQEIPPEAPFDEPPQETERRVALAREVSAPKVAVGYHAPELSHADNAALSILSVILCGGDTGRLVRRFVHEEEAASDVSSWVGSFRLPALMEFHVDLREGRDLDEATRILDEELEKLLSAGVTQEELATAKNRVLLGFYDGFSGVGGRASALGFYETVLGDCGAITRRLVDLKKVTAQDVLEASHRTIEPSRRTIVTVVPVKR